MSKYKIGAMLFSIGALAACVTPNKAVNAHNEDRVVCKKVYLAGSHIPKKVCGPTSAGGLSDIERERMRQAIGRPIVTERDVAGGGP